MKTNVLVPMPRRPMSLQVLFNRAWKHNEAGNKRCIMNNKRCIMNDIFIGGFACAYRNKNRTNACFLGISIPDKVYDEDMEYQFDDVFAKMKDENIWQSKIDNEVLNNLQSCHDDNKFKKGRTKALILFARENNLKIPKV